MIINSLIVHYEGDEVLVENAASILTYGRRRSTLALKDVYDRTAAIEKAQQEMERILAEDSKTTLRIDAPNGSGDVPYIDYALGDWVQVAPGFDGTGTADVRSVGFSLSMDEDGLLEWGVEAQSSQEEASIRLARAIGRASPGTLAGRSGTAVVKTDDDPRVRAGKLSYENVIWGGPEGYLQESPTLRVSKKSRLTFVDFTRGYDESAPQGPMGLTVNINGTPISQFRQNNIGPNSAISVLDEVNHVVALIYETVVTEIDSITFEITSGASGAFAFDMVAAHLE